jgi:hypothetical protein
MYFDIYIRIAGDIYSSKLFIFHLHISTIYINLLIFLMIKFSFLKFKSLSDVLSFKSVCLLLLPYKSKYLFLWDENVYNQRMSVVYNIIFFCIDVVNRLNKNAFSNIIKILNNYIKNFIIWYFLCCSIFNHI